MGREGSGVSEYHKLHTLHMSLRQLAFDRLPSDRNPKPVSKDGSMYSLNDSLPPASIHVDAQPLGL